MRIDNRSGGLRPPQQTKIPLARLYYPIWCCGGRRPPLRKRCSCLNYTLYCMLRRQETSATLVIPVGFKPTTFRTFSRPSLSALKTKKVQPRKDAPPGDSGGIQTHDLQNRNLTLYSAKLRDPLFCRPFLQLYDIETEVDCKITAFI